MRQKLIQVVFCFDWRQEKIDAKSTLKELCDNYENCRDDLVSFGERALENILKNLPEIKKIIERLAPEWPLEKIFKIDKALLYVGIGEMMNPSDDLNYPMIINEYVDLAKEFSGGNSPRFINGVLNSAKKEFEKSDK